MTLRWTDQLVFASMRRKVKNVFLNVHIVSWTENALFSWYVLVCEFVTSRIFVCIGGRVRHRAIVTRKRWTYRHVVWKKLVSTHTEFRAKSEMNNLFFSTYFNCCVNMCIYNTVILIISNATVSKSWTVFLYCCFYLFVFGRWTVADKLSSIFWYRTNAYSGCVNSVQSIIINPGFIWKQKKITLCIQDRWAMSTVNLAWHT